MEGGIEMTQEIKDKLEQVYEFHAKEGTIIREADSLSAFLTGAQTILENPSEWFPPVQYWQLRDENEWLQSQLTKYRELLGQLKELHSDHELTCVLIEEALKQ